MEATFSEGRDVSDHGVLASLAESAGLDGDAARKVLESNRYAEDVRAAERHWWTRGIHSVPAIVVDGHYLISGAQPPEAIEEALRKVAASKTQGRHPAP